MRNKEKIKATNKYLFIRIFLDDDGAADLLRGRMKISQVGGDFGLTPVCIAFA